ncbi:uncharacterized protein RAG0_03502 [Rhynchosporium agropyri]|uniref:Uncharacterized protein n=1 Tax=Rhynchosporium agropyri TaxID=914238 RepID=A0A1E1K554_9HELO|nr:uncharacterized protein RAG0_03502 [Rhynchosporium agropyri]
MLAKYILAVAFAGVATAGTPTGFQPNSSKDLIVAFGSTLALNGKSMTKAETVDVPTIGTKERLKGTYTLIMVDPDIPPQTPGGKTGELLHWMQQGLTSSSTATMIGGMMVYVLKSASNETAFAPYFGPSPPNKAPNTHRYTQLLLDTSNSNGGSAMALLKQAAATRLNFNAVNVVKGSGAKIMAANSFNVTNGTTMATAASKNDSSSNPSPVAPPINTSTLKPSNITKLNPQPQMQQPGSAAPGGGAGGGANITTGNSNGTSSTAKNGTTGSNTTSNAGSTSGSASGSTTGSINATNGTRPAGPAPTSGFGKRGGGAYVAGFLALAAALFLL